MSLITKDDSFRYHACGAQGKACVVPTKPCSTQRHLSMAYTPGVADVCRAIHDDAACGYDYTNKGNLIAVVTNGTAVLGLGDIGPLAGKPVMEGKGVLFKAFADIDVYDLCIEQKDPKQIIEFVKMLEPTFGGINLEDIKAPECFEIEQTLVQQMDIPVFHDDQHGTAIISGAGLLAALDLAGKRAENVKVVVSGAGAGAIACTEFFVALGVQRKNVFMFDSRGLIHKGRTNLNSQKLGFAQEEDHGSLADVMRGADVFLGLSVGGMVTQDMVASMAQNPIVFACANPDPEIAYADAKAVRDDLIMATGRSDYPNQINNVLGFPFIFRGALDVRASTINEEMKMAAARALAALAKEPVPADVLAAYDLESLSYGVEYIIPKALDPRVIEWVAPAVAEAAMRTGVARVNIDIDAYPGQLRERMAVARARMDAFIASYNLDV